MSDVYTVQYVLQGKNLIPQVEQGIPPHVLEIQNAEKFQDQLIPGAKFFATCVLVTGPARAPKKMVLQLTSACTSKKSVSPLEDFWIQEDQLRLMRADVHYGRAIRLVGPKGTGKTTFAKLFAQELRAPFIKVDGTGVFKPKDLFGAETGSAGTLFWKPSDLSVFIETHRAQEGAVKGVVCLDEFSRMGHSMAPFHALFDQTKQFSFTTCEGTVVIDRLDGFVFILTDNPVGAGYVGNHGLDAAMDDRVESYEFTYPPVEWETSWLCKSTHIVREDAEKIVSVATEARTLALAQAWAKGGPSPRRTLCAAQDVAYGIELEDALQQRIVRRYDDTDANSERAMLIARLRAKGFIREPVLHGQDRMRLRDASVGRPS